MKKKLLFIVLSVLVLIFIFLIIKYFSVGRIRNSYNKYVITSNDAELYDHNHSVIGSVSKDVFFELDDLSKNDGYFKVKGYDYFLYYSDLSKTTNNHSSYKDYYVDLGKLITTGDNSYLYQDGLLKISLNSSLTLSVKRMDENYYYVDFLGDFFQIKIDDVVDIKSSDIPPISDYVSVLNYKSIKDVCDADDCVTNDEFKNQLNYLNENGYYTIDVDDYKLWLNGYINLKEKAIFITSKQDGLNDISSLYGFFVEQNIDDLSFSDSNFRSEKGNKIIPRYNIIGKTTFDVFKEIVNGEDIIYITEKPILKSHNLPDLNSNASQIAVLNYHFFYDSTIGEACSDGNCIDIQDFENELLFLRKNNYKTLTMDEFTKWMYGEIELPARSVLLTIDDGALGTGTHNGNKLIPALEKYQSHATLFLITGWWPIDNYRSPFLDIESHTFDMHEGGYCSDVPRGSKLLCSSREKVLEDLGKSIEITGSKNAFCFPMYVYNDITLSVMSELGFKLGFVGGDVKASRSNDKYKVPRYHIYNGTSLDQFIDMIS